MSFKICSFNNLTSVSKFSRAQALRSGDGVDQSDYQDSRLGQDNKGFRMLQRMGWAEGAGLGQGGQGITAPVGK